MSFINGILIVTMGEIGPILYSVSNKLRSLLISPVKGYGRGLMSVTGHLFGAESFDKLEEMFDYVIKISVYTSLAIMIAFIFIRNYAFSLFSITGMEDRIFWIAVGGSVIITTSAVSRIASKMLDGFGKSPYSLAITIIKVAFECILIYYLAKWMPDGYPVVIGITISEIVSSIAYYKLLKYMFKHFDEEYKLKYTVKAFTIKRKDKREKLKEQRRQRREQHKQYIEEKRQKRKKRAKQTEFDEKISN